MFVKRLYTDDVKKTNTATDDDSAVWKIRRKTCKDAILSYVGVFFVGGGGEWKER